MDKNNTRPQRMNVEVMEQLLSQQIGKNNDSFFLSKDIGVSRNATFFNDVMKSGFHGPLLVEDYRVGLVLEGEIDITINLIHHHVTPGTLVYIGLGSIVTIHSVSPDIKMRGCILPEETMNNIFADRKPEIINGQMMHFFAESTTEDRQFIDDMNLTVWNIIHRESYYPPVLYSALASVLYFYEGLYFRLNDVRGSQVESNRSREIFNRFISLVNKNSSCERTLSYYADQLCLSPRYLSSLVNEQSGHPAKYWIDKATITRAKVMLRHTTKSVSQIAYELNFPNDSFFCKYFRRLAGCSPTDYRK